MVTHGEITVFHNAQDLKNYKEIKTPTFRPFCLSIPLLLAHWLVAEWVLQLCSSPSFRVGKREEHQQLHLSFQLRTEKAFPEDPAADFP